MPMIGALLLAHTTIFSALLTHECIHQTMFKNPRLSTSVGNFMTVLSGACFVSYDRLKQQHFDHHRNRVGYDGFSITRWVLSLPAGARRTVIALEYCYIPILSVIGRWRALVLPFFLPKHKELRPRITFVFVARVSFYSLVFVANPWSLTWIFASWIAMLNILRVFDCFHHTFDIIPLGAPMPRLGRDYEQANTYSSLISRKWPWLNWLFLNYGYHNAHHAKPSSHWLELPSIDRMLYPVSETHCIRCPDLVTWYHRNRIRRIYNGLGRPRISDGKLMIGEFWGVIMNISFIVYDV